MRFTHLINRFGRWFRDNSPPATAQKMLQRRLELEGLEERTLLNATLSPTGVLTVNGDDFGLPLGDTIALRENASNSNLFEVVVNGTIQRTEPISVLTRVIVNSGGGGDTITVQNLANTSPLFINAGDGSDTINLGIGNLDQLHGAITVNGQDGTDTVNLNDNAVPFRDTYTVTSTRLRRFASDGVEFFGGLSYFGVEGVVLNAANGNNTVTVESSASGTILTVNAGAGNDTVNLGTGVRTNLGTGALDDLEGGVVVHGQEGTDSVTLNDATEFFNDTYTITNSSVSRPFFGTLVYNGIENLTLNAESGNNIINVQSTDAATTLTVNGDAGSDTINVGSGNLDNVAGPVIVHGEGPDDAIINSTDRDSLTVNDAAASFSDTYTVTSSTISRPFFGGVTFHGVSVVLNGESGNNTFDLLSNGPAMTINGGAGNDTFKFHPGNFGLTVDGQVGSDTLDYAAFTTGVFVQLSQDSATATTPAGARNIENAIGGSGNDSLFGDAGNNILVGGIGIDRIDGGDGFDLLIGGAGADIITGAGGDDILIGGITSFDGNIAALQAIMAEWTSGRALDARVANIRGAGAGNGLNGGAFLKSSGPGQTVFEDGAGDQLIGGAGADWFFTNLGEGNDLNLSVDRLN